VPREARIRLPWAQKGAPGTNPSLGASSRPLWGWGWAQALDFCLRILVLRPQEGFVAMDGTKPHEFIGFGAMDATKPYDFIGLGPCMPPNPMNL
jgi:hypothetical protein